jgi:hypothetical protein
MIATLAGVRRLFADPDEGAEDVRGDPRLATVHGAPSRTSVRAHLGDGVTYPIIRLFPRRLRASLVLATREAVSDPVAEKLDKQPSSHRPRRLTSASFRRSPGAELERARVANAGL